LPNVITVGAVDYQLQATSFTSFGSSIDLYANGFRVPARMPGGLKVEASGTSMAAPQVTNLAAKMLTIEPELTPEQLVALLKQHATIEGEQKLPVVHPVSTVCALAIDLPACKGQKVAGIQ